MQGIGRHDSPVQVHAVQQRNDHRDLVRLGAGLLLSGDHAQPATLGRSRRMAPGRRYWCASPVPAGAALKRPGLRTAIAIPLPVHVWFTPNATNASPGEASPEDAHAGGVFRPGGGHHGAARGAPCPGPRGRALPPGARASATVITASAPSVRPAAGGPRSSLGWVRSRRRRRRSAGYLRWARQGGGRTGSAAARPSGRRIQWPDLAAMLVIAGCAEW